MHKLSQISSRSRIQQRPSPSNFIGNLPEESSLASGPVYDRSPSRKDANKTNLFLVSPIFSV